MSTRRAWKVSRSVGRVILVGLAVTIVFDWPLLVAVALITGLAGMFVVVARLPSHPDKPPVDRSRLTRSESAVYHGSSVLLLLAIAWLLVGLSLAEGSRDLAAPSAAFVVAAFGGKWHLAIIRRRAALDATSPASTDTTSF